MNEIPAGQDGIPAGIPSVLSVDEFLDPQATWRGSAAENICAVLGRPIEHSLSPLLHNTCYQPAGLDFTYVRVEAGEGVEIRRLLENSSPDVRGFSVTMPGKTAALELADQATERALAIGSANTLVAQRDAQGNAFWLADNTDVDGVTSCLEDLQAAGRIEFTGARAVIVGNGGTARPAVAALAAMGVSAITVLARSERALNLQELVTEFGMEFSWARFDQQPVEEFCAQAAVAISTIPASATEPLTEALLRAQSVIDVIYDPYPTPLLTAASARRVPHSDGLRMLAGQAERQFELFTGRQPVPGMLWKTALSRR